MKIGIQLMVFIHASQDTASSVVAGLAGRLRAGSAEHPERGDVPGWVMITFLIGA